MSDYNSVNICDFFGETTEGDTEYTVGKVFTDTKSGKRYKVEYLKTTSLDRARKLEKRIDKMIHMNDESDAFSYIDLFDKSLGYKFAPNLFDTDDKSVYCDVCGVDYDAESLCEFH
tara:strand:- start:493 stop:840 length:348 start_codon:yes stop_codon:yes gene_type:complete